jgi:site-specific DNA-methyltransferase (adenine-specific)
MMTRTETLAEGVTLICGDCREVLPTLGRVDHIISDPPYEAVMQNKWGVLSRNAPSSHVQHESLGFDAIDHMREAVARAAVNACQGWCLFFCMAEGVRAWRDAIEIAGAKYKRAMVWVKPDAMPQFNGQGPSTGHEMLVSAWCGAGHSKWNGGGRPGVFIFTKNTQGAEHPTQKPLPLMSELVQLFSFAGDLVCDPFCGYGWATARRNQFRLASVPEASTKLRHHYSFIPDSRWVGPRMPLKAHSTANGPSCADGSATVRFRCPAHELVRRTIRRPDEAARHACNIAG